MSQVWDALPEDGRGASGAAAAKSRLQSSTLQWQSTMVAVATLRLTSPDHPPTYGPARQTPKDTPESGDAKNPPLSGPLSAKSAKMEAASISLYKAKADAEGRSPKPPAGPKAPSVPRKTAGDGGFSKTKLADTPILVWATPAAKSCPRNARSTSRPAEGP